MDMQREDFLKLWKLPEMFYTPEFFFRPGQKANPLPTRSGMGSVNLSRVLTDWFPQGAIVSIEGRNFISRGVERSGAFDRCGLSLLDPQTLKSHSFSIFEALALAELSIKDSSDAQA